MTLRRSASTRSRGLISDGVAVNEKENISDSMPTAITTKESAYTDQETATVLSSSPPLRGERRQENDSMEDSEGYPKGMKLILIMSAACLAVFLVALDNSIIATAIPKITNDFQSLGDVGWYGSAYLLTTSSLQLLFGKFYSVFSLKWVYLIVIAIFEIGSLICGVAQSSITLIIGRAIAGLGSAGILSGSFLVVGNSVPLVKRPIYTIYGIANVAGPLIGGAFADKVTWRWCFYINLPIGALSILVIIIFLPKLRQVKPELETGSLLQRINRFDPVGTVVFIPAIICLLLALQWGGTTYPWREARIVALFVVAGILLIAFVVIQIYQGEDATVPVRVIKNRTVWSCGFFVFCLGAAFFIMVYYIPIWFQAVQDTSAVDSGIRNLPVLIAVVIVGLLAGHLVTAFGYYAPFVILSSLFTAVGGGLVSTWQPETGTGVWIGYQLLFGIGVGFGMQQPLIAVQTVLELADVPTGTAIMVFMQSLGGSLFVSIGNTVFGNGLVQALEEYAQGVDPAVVQDAGASGFQDVLPADAVSGVVLSYNEALTKTFLVSAILGALSILGSVFVEWKSVKHSNVDTSGIA